MQKSITNHCLELKTNKFSFSDYNNDKIYVDGSYPAFIRCLKMLIRERSDHGIVIEQAKKRCN